MELQKSLRALKELLSRICLDLSQEVITQNDLESHLKKISANYKRERRLSNQDRVDFYFPNSGVALEIKIKKNWSKEEIFRQLERYSKHDEVKAVVLLTNIAMTLPNTISEKPAMVIKLREGI